MRFAFQGSILLCFIATQFSGYNARVVPTALHCDDGKCLPKLTLPVLHDFQRRAGGGGGGKGGGTGGGTSGGGGGNSGGEDSSSGTDGGLSDGDQETEGGLGENCPRKRSWLLFLKRSPASCTTNNAPADNPPANNPPNANEGPPLSARNNRGQPAVKQEQTYYPAQPINLAETVARFQTRITNQGLTGGPWYFYSGFPDRDDGLKVALPLSEREGVTRTTPAWQGAQTKPMADMSDVMGPESADEIRQAFSKTADMNYFWGMYSKAYAQAITGKVYVVIPKGRPINTPYNNKGSMWWSFEAPELSRSPGITEINYVAVTPDPQLDLETGKMDYEMGPNKVIWRQGDAPIGTQGDPLHEVDTPLEQWNG